jgi:hypothetical protein
MFIGRDQRAKKHVGEKKKCIVNWNRFYHVNVRFLFPEDGPMIWSSYNIILCTSLCNWKVSLRYRGNRLQVFNWIKPILSWQSFDGAGKDLEQQLWLRWYSITVKHSMVWATTNRKSQSEMCSHLFLKKKL